MARDPAPRVAAVILNYRTPDDTIALVHGLQRDRVPLDDLIVVDNASGDGSAERFARGLSGVQLIVAGRNDGFSAGCNLGIRRALERGASRVLLLNSDVRVPSGAVEALNRALDDDPTLGSVGPMLVTRADPDVIESLGIDFVRWSGRMRHRGAGTRRTDAPSVAPRRCDGVSGCAMLIRREAFDAAGLLTDEYFFGFEDLDFCLRAREAGYGTACVPTAVVEHQGSASIGRSSPRRVYFAVRNHLLVARRCARPDSWLGRLMQTTSIVGLNLAYVLFRARLPLTTGLAALARGVLDHRRGVFGGGSWR